MSCYLIGDPHLSHKNIANFRTFVSSQEDNENLFVDSWRNTIKKQDIVFVLGDAAFDKAGLDLLGNLKGRKILVKGNHDIEVSTADQLAVFEEIHGIIRYKKLWLTHCPIHPQEMRGCVGNVHGHCHTHEITKRNWIGKKIKDKRYLNVCVDINYRDYESIFITLDQVKRHFGI